MLLPRTNIEKKLISLRKKKSETFDWRKQIQLIFEVEEQINDQIERTLKQGEASDQNAFIFDHLDTNKIYHIDQIKKICIDYRLRFLDSRYFKGKLPKEAYTKIKNLEKKHETKLTGFKIMAPSKLFKLANADDPLLFAPMGNNYFYLIHKWGNDLHPLRRFTMWFFKSFENLTLLTCIISLLVTLLVPDGLFSKENNTATFFMVFLFMFKSIAAIVLFYGFALGKNFNTAIWNSKFFNA
ncbi:hypothetical protein GCM10022393_38220 [Aquimarina addita]|uniref:Uncharacterized protein n=1 Tax=Aquimarina addita TaxID=870485 RepID=A0ABP6UVB8_9FLAO